MKYIIAHEQQAPLRRPITVTRLENLHGAAAVQPPVAPGKTLYISRFAPLPTFYVAAEPTPAAEKSGAGGEPPKRVTLGGVVKNVGIGGMLAAQPVGLIPLARHTTEAQLAAQLTNYGFEPNASGQIASSALEFARSNFGHLCCVFLSGTAIAIGTVEAIRPNWSWNRKITVSVIAGAIIAILALILIYMGVWGEQKGSGRDAVRPATQAGGQPSQR
jgi:hypothetical protein